MEQLVRIREVYPDGTAQAVHIRESACSGDCHKCSGCGAAKETILLTVGNPIGARPGDTVTVRTDSGPVLKAAAVLYMIPLLLFFAGYAVGAALEMSGALFGALGFALGVLIAVCYDRKMEKKKTEYMITGFAGESLLKSLEKGDNDLG